MIHIVYDTEDKIMYNNNIFIFNDLRREMIFCFVDIGGIAKTFFSL